MLGGRAFSVWTPFHHPIGRQPTSPHAPLEGPLRHLVAPDILERRLVWGPAEEDRELLDEANVVVLGRWLKLTDRHIPRSCAVARLVAVSVMRCSCLNGGCQSPIFRQDAA